MLWNLSWSQQGNGAHELMWGVRGWIEYTDSPSGLGAQPPVTPLQPQQEIIQFHPQAIRRSPGRWSILLASRENRSYLVLCPSRPLFLSITSKTPDTLSHLAESLTSARLCHINSCEQSALNPDLVFYLNFPFKLFSSWKTQYGKVFGPCFFKDSDGAKT